MGVSGVSALLHFEFQDPPCFVQVFFKNISKNLPQNPHASKTFSFLSFLGGVLKLKVGGTETLDSLT
jgi:hypothetical protein